MAHLMRLLAASIIDTSKTAHQSASSAIVPAQDAASLGSPATDGPTPLMWICLAIACIGACICVSRRSIRILNPIPSGRIPRDGAIGAVAMFLFFAAGSVGAIVGAQLSVDDEAFARLTRATTGNIAQLLCAAAFILSPLFVVAARTKCKVLPAITAGIMGFVLVAPLVTGAALLVNVVLTFMGEPPAPTVAHSTLILLRDKGDLLFTVLTLAQVTLLVPLAEELGWRGLLQPSLRAAGLGAYSAVLVTALLFASIHWSVIPVDGRAAGLIMLFMLGIALGMLRERTGGVLASVVLHGVFNAANVALVLA